jgi:hypothetical protein
MAYQRASRPRGVYRRRRYEYVVNRRKYYAPSYTSLLTVQLGLIDSGPAVYAPTVTAMFDHSDDTYNRTVSAGAWGTADYGGDWEISGGANALAFSVNPTDGGRISSPSTSTREARLAQVQRGVDQRHRIDVAWLTGGTPTGTSIGWVEVSVRARDIHYNHYAAAVKFLVDNSITISIIRRLVPSDTILVADTVVSGLTWVADHYYRIEIEASGYSPTTIRARVYDSTAGSVSGWLVTTTDSSAVLQDTGGPALQLWNPASSTTVQAAFDEHHFGAIPAAQTLTLGLIDGASTVYSPSLRYTQDLTLGLVDGADAVYAPTVTRLSVGQAITLPLADAADAVYAPVVIPNQFVTVPLLDGAPAVYAPQVLGTVQQLTLGLLDSVSALYAPTLTLVQPPLVLPLLDSGPTTYAPTVSLVSPNDTSVYTPDDGRYTGEAQAIHVVASDFAVVPLPGPASADQGYSGSAAKITTNVGSPTQWDNDSVMGPSFDVGVYRGVSQAIHVFGNDDHTVTPPPPVPGCKCCEEHGDLSPGPSGDCVDDCQNITDRLNRVESEVTAQGSLGPTSDTESGHFFGTSDHGVDWDVVIFSELTDPMSVRMDGTSAIATLAQNVNGFAGWAKATLPNVPVTVQATTHTLLFTIENAPSDSGDYACRVLFDPLSFGLGSDLGSVETGRIGGGVFVCINRLATGSSFNQNRSEMGFTGSTWPSFGSYGFGVISIPANFWTLGIQFRLTVTLANNTPSAGQSTVTASITDGLTTHTTSFVTSDLSAFQLKKPGFAAQKSLSFGGADPWRIKFDSVDLPELPGVNACDCPECDDPDTGLPIPDFTPGYLPIFRRQIGDPTTSLDSFLCTLESGAMLLDWQTRGAVQVWGGELIPYCGRTEAEIIGHGTNLSNVQQAWLHWDQHLSIRSGGSWFDLLDCLGEGRAVELQGDYGVFTLNERCQDSFEGNHAITIYPYALSGRLLVGDPLCGTFKNFRETSLKAYAEALGVAVFGVTSPQKILFAVSRPWAP